MSIFRNTLFNRVRFATFGAPRRPRHPFLRLALGLVHGPACAELSAHHQQQDAQSQTQGAKG